MKTWFKYRFGFVNLDENNIYFSTTGNWSDAERLEESSRKMKRADVLSRGSTILFMAVFYIIGFVLFLLNVSQSAFSIVVLVGLPFAGYHVYKYFQRDLGRSFMIPRRKILEVTVLDENVKIVFTNGNEETEEFELEKVEEKGIRIFEEIFLAKKMTANVEPT